MVQKENKTVRLTLNYVIRATLQDTASKGLLDIIASSKDKEQPNQSLIMMLGGENGKETSVAMTDEQFKLPDLITPELTKEGKTELEQERELLKPLPNPSLKPRAYSRTHFDKTKIKTGVAIQCKQHQQWAEKLLEQNTEPELTLDEMENITRKEEVRLRRAEQHG